MNNSSCRTCYAWLVWFIAAVFYAYEFFVRLSPAVMVHDLMQHFNVTAVSLGDLSAYYYYAYAFMQIPVGILVDRFGVRLMLAFGAGLVALGCGLFAGSESLQVAEIGRLLMGAGSAFAFVSCLKLGTAWFPAERFALIVGLTNTVGVIGAVLGEAPLAYFISQTGWMASFWWATGFGGLLAILILLIVRDKPAEISDLGIHFPFCEKSVLQSLKTVLKRQETWWVALFAGFVVAPIAGFAELWAVDFLAQVHQLPHIAAALLASLIFVGIGVGGPTWGWLVGNGYSRQKLMFIGTSTALLCLLILLFVPIITLPVVMGVLFIFGFASSNMLLAFSLNVEANPPSMKGIVIGFTNMLVMVGGTVFQPITGWILDSVWDGKIDAVGTPVFTHWNFQVALSVLPVCLILALCLIPKLKTRA